MQLPAILFAAASLVASLATLISVIRGHSKLDAIQHQVNGGMTALQTALADIAKTAATSKTVVVKEGQRMTDRSDTAP